MCSVKEYPQVYFPRKQDSGKKDGGGSLIQILDTTLRDGEQTDGVSFSAGEKLQVAQFLLQHLRVDRIEIASARVSPAESPVFTQLQAWAQEQKLLDCLEILGFVDHGRSVQWVKKAGFRVINFLTKGSRKHCELQLKKDQSQHLLDIAENIQLARDQGLTVNAFLEDWSNGCKDSPDYVQRHIAKLIELGVERIYLPDTLGIFGPEETLHELQAICEQYPKQHFEFHGHNDYDLAVANCLSAVQAGAKGLHVTVNGLGERAGNSPLEAVVCALHDKTPHWTNIQENQINTASLLIENFSGKKIQANRPIVGQDVFTQTAGVHADGDKKARLYVSDLDPDRFGRKFVYALGKQAGLASVAKNLESLGIQLDSDQTKILLTRIKELGEKKHTVTVDDLPLLIRDIFDEDDTRDFVFEDVEISSSLRGKPKSRLKIRIFQDVYEGDSEGDGGYDAFMQALRKVLAHSNLKHIKIAELIDYEIHIPPGGRSDALVKCSISWQIAPRQTMRTVGVSTDQVLAAVHATEKMLNRLNINSKTKN